MDRNQRITSFFPENASKRDNAYLNGDEGASRIVPESFQDVLLANKRDSIWELALKPGQRMLRVRKSVEIGSGGE